MIDEQLLVESPAVEYTLAIKDFEYSALENLIVRITDQLDADWSYDPEADVYVVELREDEESKPELVSVYTEICGEGFNEGREMFICEADVGIYAEDENADGNRLLEVLKLSEPLIFSHIYITTENQVVLSARTLTHELSFDVAAAMVEEVSSFAGNFRDELENL